jgi:DegV family protein with EDD domain
MIRIVTDSTCDLPAEWLDAYSITVVPVNIQFGLETYQEGVTISPEAFYGRIARDGVLPTTSQPAVGEYCRIYEKLAGDGSDILSIHLTSKLSGTWHTAQLAARQLGDRASVTVIDSFTGSVGLGLMIREAAQLAAAGLPVTEIVNRLKARRAQVFAIFMLNDLRYARMSGRVGRIRENLVSVLNLKPIIGVKDGALVSLERVRGTKRGFDTMISLAEQFFGSTPVHVGVAHAICQQHAETLLAQAQTRLNCRNTFMADLATSIAVHLGPGAIGFAAYPAE